MYVLCMYVWMYGWMDGWMCVLCVFGVCMCVCEYYVYMRVCEYVCVIILNGM